MSKLVVFVHGLGANENEFWRGTPQVLRNCSLLNPNVDVRFWGYETSKKIRPMHRVLARFGSGYPLESISSLGEHLWSILRLWFRDGDYNEVRLLGHSMGGLVIASAGGYGLERNVPEDKDLIKTLSAIAFVATPLGGANLVDRAGPLFQSFGANVQVEDLAQGSDSRAMLVNRFVRRALKPKKVGLTVFRASNDQVVKESEVDEPLVSDKSLKYSKEVLVGTHSGCVQDLSVDSDNIKMLIHWANGEKLTANELVELAKQGKPVSVFVSRPSTLTKRQQAFWNEFEGLLCSYGLKPRTLGLTDVQKEDGGMYDVLNLLRECHGAVIVGLSQVQVDKVTFKRDTEKEREQEHCEFATPWNHMEACMAFAEGIPLLIIKEESVYGDGIFDKSCLRLTPYETDLEPAWLEDRLRPAIAHWVDKVAGAATLRG